ncbi:MAG: hypothetical protein M3458_08070 [Acidobacteriota bacterium]|nr:hypothetical protein [Acidobacteriota bacterium]
MRYLVPGKGFALVLIFVMVAQMAAPLAVLASYGAVSQKTKASTDQEKAPQPSSAPSSLKPALDFGLSEDTPVRLRLGRTISSGTEKLGDKVDFEVIEAVKIGDVVVVQQGATAIATVTEAQPKRRMALESWM